MSSVSSSELSCWENKDLSAWFGPVDQHSIEHDEATSFFELGFDSYDQEIFDSSDASISAGFNFFDEVDFVPTDTDATAFSSTVEGPSSVVDSTRVRSKQRASPRLVHQYIQQSTSIPTSQRLVHRLRPEGAAISSADLLSLEGRKKTPLNRPSQPKTPPATPQHRSGLSTSKTLRTPRERLSRILKAPNTTGSMRSPKKAMHPSNYYASPETPSMRDWSERFTRFSSAQPNNSLPLSPPSSSRIPQSARPSRLVTPQQQHQRSPSIGSPTPTAAVPSARHVSTATSMPIPIPMPQPSKKSLENDAEQLAPLLAWSEAANGNLNGFAFSPLSPTFPDAQWASNSAAHVQNSQFEPFSSNSTSSPFSSVGTSGLMIDFGDSSNPFAESYDVDPSAGMSFFPATSSQVDQVPTDSFEPEPTNPFSQMAQHQHGFPSRSSTPSPRSHIRAISRPQSQSPSQPISHSSYTLPRSKRALPSHIRAPSSSSSSITPSSSHGPPASITSSSSTRSNTHRRTQSSNKPTSSGVAKHTTSSRPKSTGRGGVQALGDMFVNFTPSDSRRILTGVAPSGSSKTKARREKEAKEERRKMSEAARKAVMMAGGDWEGLEGLVVSGNGEATERGMVEV